VEGGTFVLVQNKIREKTGEKGKGRGVHYGNSVERKKKKRKKKGTKGG